MNGYVSADRLGNGDVRYPNGDTSKRDIPQSTVLATRFVPEYPAKPGGPGIVLADAQHDRRRGLPR